MVVIVSDVHDLPYDLNVLLWLLNVFSFVHFN
jgi:hypothetical protein